MSKMDIPQPVFTIEPSEPKPEPQDVLIGCIKVDIYSQFSGVTGNVEEEALKTDSRSKPDIGGSEADSQVPRLGRSKGTDSPPQEDCQIFICEVCEEEFNEGVFLLKHKLDSHWIPIEMSLTHLPGHKTCMNCRKYLSESVEQNVAVFLTKPCKQCISGKCYLCETCKSHFYLSDHFKTALKLKLLNPKGQSWQNSALKLPKPKEYTWTVGSHSLNGFQPLLPTSYEQPATLSVNGRADHRKKPKQKTASRLVIRTKTQVKADVKFKTGAQDSAKISETSLEQTPKQRKKKSCKERIPKKKDVLLCPQCGKTFTKPESLTNHLKNHSDERPFICDVCNKSFMLQKYLKLHQRQHTGEKPYTCGECGRGFARRSSLRYHCLTHTKTKQFQCDRCPKTFLQKIDLRYHIERHNGTYSKQKKRQYSEKNFICDVCGKGYAEAYRLKDHKITHRPTGELPFQCDACGKSFSRQGHLTDHFTIMHMKRTLPCPTCHKKFPTLVRMKKHCRVSHAEKSFKCEECTMAFISQKHLDRHMYRHTGKSPHVCENCGRRFSTGTYCRAHQKNCY